MQPTVYAFICGHTTIAHQLIVDGAEGMITLPVPAFLIDHPEGLFVFDTGFNRRVHSDPQGGYVPGDFYNTRRLDFSPEEELPTQMRRTGFDPGAVRFVANSHLHYDHCGGNDLFPQATVLLQEAEYLAAATASDEVMAYRKPDFLTGQTKLLLNGEHDVFGDGSVRLVPTYGHTPGHQSLRIQTAENPVLLTADACYLEQTLEATAIPGQKTDEQAFRDSLNIIRAFRDSGGLVAFGHDADFWQRMPLAPQPLAR